MTTRSLLPPGPTVGFIGLGNMGRPMVRRLADAGYRMQGYDLSEAARERLTAETGIESMASAAVAVADAAAIVFMLPTSSDVRDVLVDDGVFDLLDQDVVVIDMGSSDPAATRALAEEAQRRGIELVDAPVSGGVRGAIAGTLTIMAGGPTETVEACMPIYEAVGTQIFHAGPVGAGHALKALNNLVSATQLLATCEAVTVGRRFGLDPSLIVAALNVSSGRSDSTERKLPQFILTETYASGFALQLMTKDMRMGVSLGERVGAPGALGAAALELWEQAAGSLPADADHTEIARWIEDKPSLG